MTTVVGSKATYNIVSTLCIHTVEQLNDVIGTPFYVMS